MLKKVYFYKISDIMEYKPFWKEDLSDFLKLCLNVENLNAFQVPSDLVTNKTIYDELFSLVLGKYRDKACVKIVKCFNEDEPTTAEKEEALSNWGIKFLSLLNDTHDVYITLLTNYAAAKTHLMDDITATSENKVGFNDTPQNPNTSQVYEGDDYLTHFTKTRGSTSSPLMSKIMRLKEIQENFRDLMSEWVRDFGRIFYEEEC